AGEKVQAGTLYELYTISHASGDTYSMKLYFGERTTQILERSRPFIPDEELIEYNLERLIEESTIYEDEGRYFLSSLYHAEWGIVNSLERMLDGDFEDISEEFFAENISDLEYELGIEYGKSQKEAIKQALESPVFILTGG